MKDTTKIIVVGISIAVTVWATFTAFGIWQAIGVWWSAIGGVLNGYLSMKLAERLTKNKKT